MISCLRVEYIGCAPRMGLVRSCIIHLDSLPCGGCHNLSSSLIFGHQARSDWLELTSMHSRTRSRPLLTFHNCRLFVIPGFSMILTEQFLIYNRRRNDGEVIVSGVDNNVSYIGGMSICGTPILYRSCLHLMFSRR